MDLKDRFIRGFIAGILSGIILDVLDLIANYLKIDELTYFDWAGLVIYGAKPHGLVGYGVAVFAQLFLTGLLGAIFAYLIPEVTSKNLILKGAIWGVTIWGLTFISVYLFKLEKLMETDTASAASDAVTGAIYGIALALILRKLNPRQKI